MPHDSPSRARLRTPSAAAVAGIAFSALLICTFWLLRLFTPADPQDSGEWLKVNSTGVAVGLNLVPLAGIAFLWFIGVLRDRLGELEDRFFATVFLGSGLLFLAMLFAAAAVAGAIIAAVTVEPAVVSSPVFHFARSLAHNLVSVYMPKMACVFMISTSTVAIYTEITPRSMALGGYALSLLLLFGSSYIPWIIVVFPIWVLLISTYILVDDLDRSARRSEATQEEGR
jgi:hypothetical protein